MQSRSPSPYEQAGLPCRLHQKQLPGPSWYSKTPSGFIFAAKVPQKITHEKMLHDCDAEMTEFLNVMNALREKLGPLLLQFGYFNKLRLQA